MKLKNFIFYLFFAIIPIFLNIGKAENIDTLKRNKLGLVLGVNYNLHKTDIPILWESANCGNFQSGKSFGFNAGLLYFYDIIPKLITADIRFLYGSVPAVFTLEKSDYRVFNPELNKYENLKLKYEFQSDLAYLLVQPGISIQPLKAFPLKFRLGIEIGNPIFKSNYSTSEAILTPKTFVFPDETQSHTIQSGDLNNAGTSISGSGSLIYEKEISRNIFLSGEVNYNYPFNSRLKDAKWEINQVGFNLTLAYAFGSRSKPKPIPPPIEPEKPKEIDTPIVVEIIPKNFEIEIQSSQIKILETTVTQTYSILPYLFFEKNSSAINPKYLQLKKDEFGEEKVSNNTLDIYYNLLNIIAIRLKKSPKSKITISGMTDGTELPELDARMKLAAERAKTVAKYFTENWEIDANQIKTGTREIPELATSNLYPEGFEENRRVEIYSDDPEILKPVIHTKFKENQLLTEEIEILFSSNSPDSISNWNLALGGVTLQKSETMESNKLNYRITPELKERLMHLISNAEPLVLDFSCNVFGKEEVRKFPIQLEKEQNSFELQRLNLIVFDFDKYELNEMNKNMISNFVTHSIQDNSVVRIIGSTDRLGEKEYNMQLSKERANTTFRYLKDLKPKANFVEVKGIGDSSLLYDNNIPEGRFYCRTVLIEVKTPIIK